MKFCPLISLPDWIELEKIHGKARAANLWVAFDGYPPKYLYTDLRTIPVDTKHSRYKILKSAFGSDGLVEDLIKGFSIGLGKGKGELYYPTINEVKKYFADNRDSTENYIKTILEKFPEVSAKGLARVLNTVVNETGDIYMVSRGWINNGSLVGKGIVEKEFYGRNLATMKKLAELYPQRFEIKDSKKNKYSHFVTINEPVLQQRLFSPTSDSEINYQLKSIDILQSLKADEIFKKGDKNNWDIDKILSELNIPKEQKELIKSFNTRNREEILTNLLANYSYTVEINTAKEKTLGDNNATYTTNGVQYVKFGENDYRKRTLNSNFEKITKEEFEKNQNAPTQYYSNLTVPGGTNYTEQEIATPGITPSIKGHAQFATDNGIGWFRSDEQAPQIKGWQKDEVDWMDSESAIYNAITPDDKIIWGHPTIGKTTAKKQKGFLDFDTDFKPLVAQKLGLPKSQQTSIGLNEWRKATGNEEAFNTAMREVWALAKKQAKSQNKILMVSDMIFLRENQSDFDKIINISSDTFINRASKRGDDVSSLQNWKNNIDKVLNNIDSKKIITTDKYLSELFEENAKTRRILELQSDLFQKGRNAVELIGTEAEILYELDKMGKPDSTNPDDIAEARKRLSTSNQNQFLQLLNKDNNWVTFFVKSIIQDSSKKGYEKVLFPTGNTASKVEGHTTLEEFKKQKEDRIKELGSQIKNTKPTYLVTNSQDFAGYDDIVFNTKEEAENYLKNKSSNWSLAERNSNEAAKLEINQLKQEIERVEKEGFGALKPIYNFYENTVANILKKQGLNPELITDEYGNTWNEVIISNELKQQVQTINFSPLEKEIAMDVDIIPKYFSTGDVQNASTILKKISYSSHPLNKLAFHLLKYAEYKDVEIVLENKDFYETKTKDGVSFKGAGFYDVKQRKIFIAERAPVKGGQIETVLLHEIIHALSSDIIHSKKGHYHVFKKLYEKSVQELGKYDGKNNYANLDMDEFFVALFTDSAFIKRLSKVPPLSIGKFESIVSEIFDYILKTLNIDKNNLSLYTQAFSVASSMLDTSFEEISSLQKIDEQVNNFYSSSPVEIKYNTKNYESYTNDIIYNGKSVGTIKTYNDGVYLNVVHTFIDEDFRRQGIAEQAYTKVGEWANSHGLIFRSNQEMHQSTINLWDKLVSKGNAYFNTNDNKYYFNGELEYTLPADIFFVENADKIESGELIILC